MMRTLSALILGSAVMVVPFLLPSTAAAAPLAPRMGQAPVVTVADHDRFRDGERRFRHDMRDRYDHFRYRYYYPRDRYYYYYQPYPYYYDYGPDPYYYDYGPYYYPRHHRHHWWSFGFHW